MTKDKQIEELARTLRFDGKDCESTQCLLCHNSKHCFERKLAEEVISKGYCKASDVARKMHSEIKERCIKGGIYPAFVERTIDQIAKEMLEEG